MSIRLRNGGFALIAALSFVVIVGVLVGTALFLATTNRRLSSDLVRTTQAQYIAETGIERVVRDYWYTMLANVPLTQRTLKQYRDNLQAAASPLADGSTITYSQIGTLGGSYSVTVTRKDETPSTVTNLPGSVPGGRTQLIVQSTGALPDGTTRVLKQTLFVGGSVFNGSDFALLSNNVNCIFCHAKVTSMADAYKIRASGEHLERVKVAGLQNLEVRTTQADTFIGGTLYSRGDFKCDTQGGTSYCGAANSITSPQNVNVKTYDLDGAARVGTTTTALAADQNCQQDTCMANANFYRNYPQGAGVDGTIPNEFPPPIKDANGNKKIDDAEWQAAIAEAVQNGAGTLSIPVNSQTSYIVNSPADQVVNPSNAYQFFKTNLATASTSNGVDGNVVLRGTADAPLNISGTVYVNGDVVISGKVRGNGKIVARGNIYVVGDVEYDCSGAPPAQGNSTCDYSRQDSLPQLGLVAGGNMLVGDYMTPKTTFVGGSKVPGVAAGKTALTDQNYIEPSLQASSCDAGGKCNITITKTDGSPLLSEDKNKALKPGDIDPSFVAAEVAVFNKREVDKAKADSSYIPRLYKMRDGDMVFQYTGGGEKPERYNQVGGIPQNVLNRAVVVSLGAKAAAGGQPWASESDLKQLWINNIETPTRPKISTLSPGNQAAGSKTDQNKPLQIDGLLYSSNAVFALAHGASKIQGSTVVNGAVIAADTGILSSGADSSNGSNWMTAGQINPGLRLHYDPRLRGLLQLDSTLVLGRSDYTLVGR